MRFAARETAIFGQPEVGLGANPGAGGIQHLGGCQGQWFGFFEAIRLSGDNHFDKFMSTTLANNDHAYAPSDVNSYLTFDGRTISFRPDHPREESGIVTMDGQPLISPRVDEWHLARGTVINADGTWMCGNQWAREDGGD